MRLILRFFGIAAVFAVLVSLQFSLPSAVAQSAGVDVTDIFGRSIAQQGITLVDWEGMIRNPALQFFVNLPEGASAPASIELSANHSRLYFDLPSEASESGPFKEIHNLSADNPQSFYISIFPDRDFDDEQYTLDVSVFDGNGQQFTTNIDIHVIDQDLDREVEYPLIVDFSEDETGLFDNPQARAVAEAAAFDWVYFLADMNFDTVNSFTEITNLPTATRSGNQESFGNRDVFNTDAYNGFLLYGVGLDFLRGPEDDGPTSTGYASTHSLQRRNGQTLPIRRSGVFAMNIHGNFDTNGWNFDLENDAWFDIFRISDFYEVTSHEMGHSLFYFSGYPLYAEAASFVGGRGFFEDPDLLAYHGSNPTVIDEHLNAGYVDRLSLQGPYGAGPGPIERGRGLPTKLDLLIIKSIGYELRETSAFIPLIVGEEAIPDGVASTPYQSQLSARGGVPFYHWEFVSGTLPDGLELNTFGELAGTPTSAGVFQFALQVRDYDELSEPVIYDACVKINNADGSAAEGSCPPLMSSASEAPIADRDGDGVPDEDDLCPDFPGQPEAEGC